MSEGSILTGVLTLREDLATLDVDHALAGASAPERALELLAERASEAFAGASGVYLVGEDRLVCPGSRRGIEATLARVAAAACGEVRGGFIANEWVPRPRAGVTHVMACPVIAGGRLRGVIAVSRGGEAAAPFTATELRHLERFAVRASLSVRQFDLGAAGARCDGRLLAMERLGGLVASVRSEGEALGGVVREATEVTGTEVAGIWVADEARGVLELRALSRADLTDGCPFSIAIWGRGVVGRAAALRRPVAWSDMPGPATETEHRWLADQGLRAGLAVPLIVSRRVSGVLALFGHEPPASGPAERASLNAVAGYGALILSAGWAAGEPRPRARGGQQSALTLVEAGRSPEVLDPVDSVARRLAATEDTQAIVSLVLEEAVRSLGAAGASLRLAVRGRLELVGATPSLRPLDQRRWLAVGESLSGLAAQTGAPVASESMPDDSRCDPRHREAARAHGLHGFLAVPLRAEAQLIGALAVFWRERHRAGMDEVTRLSALADEAALALARARAFDRLRQARARQAAQFSVTRVLAEAATIDEAMPEVLRAICEGFSWDAGEAWRLESGSGVLRWQTLWHRPELDVAEFEASSRDLTFPAGTGLPGRCLAAGRPAWMADVTRDPRFVRTSVALRAGLRAGLAFPVRAGGESLGVLVFFSREAREPDEEMLEIAADLGAQIGQFIRRRMAEESLRRSEERLGQVQRLEAIGRLTGGIAHDFGNLLSVILSYSEMMVERLDERDPVRPAAVQIRKAGLRAASLVRQLLAFGRRQVLQPRVLDLNAVVVDMTTMLRRLIGEHIRLVTRLEPGLGAVRVDPSQLAQVLLNLAINARDAMPSGGTLTIETANVRGCETRQPGCPGPGSWVMLAVGDTGHGMDAETRAHIFEPFFTTKGPGRGTGLGLATVHGIVKQSGGEIEVESEPMRGAVFRIYWPRVPGELAADALEVEAPGPGGKATVLLVEDEEGVRDLAQAILEGAGYTVLAADGGAAALEIARGHPDAIHVLLTDVIMPEMNGRELAHRVAAARPGIRVVFMTGYGYEAMGPGGLLEEDAMLVEKPFTPASLLRRVHEALHGGQSHGQ